MSVRPPSRASQVQARSQSSKPLADFQINGLKADGSFDGTVTLGNPVPLGGIYRLIGNPGAQDYSAVYHLNGSSAGQPVQLILKVLPDGKRQLGKRVRGSLKELTQEELEGLRESVRRKTFGFSGNWLAMEQPVEHILKDGTREQRVPKKEFRLALL